MRQSVLDLVAEQAADLKGRLGQADQQKVDQYFTSVREIEQRIARAAENEGRRRGPTSKCPKACPATWPSTSG